MVLCKQFFKDHGFYYFCNLHLVSIYCFFWPPTGVALWIHACMCMCGFLHLSVCLYSTLLRLSKRAQNRVFLVVLKFHHLVFAGINLNGKALQLSVFLCQSHIWENSGSQVVGQNTLVQSDWRILWSSISLEVIHQFLRFFSWIYLLRKATMWDCCFFLS